MSSQQYIVDQNLGRTPEGASQELPIAYDTSPEVLPTSQPRLGADQKDPDRNSRPEPAKGKICGMKRKTFMIVLGIFIALIIAVAAGVGGGVAATATKSGNNSESKHPEQQIPSEPTDSESPSPISNSSSLIDPFFTPTPTPILKDTPLAAVNWNTSAIQLFYKHTDGTIRSQESKVLRWDDQSATITKPRDDSGVAAIGWLSGTTRVQQVRLYTVSASNILMESNWNTTTQLWFDRPILPQELDPPAAGSHLAAHTWFNGTALQIRVYYQGKDGLIREAAHGSGGWTKKGSPRQNFPQARNGTGLAFVLFPDPNGPVAKLYYQSTDGKLTSYDYKPTDAFAQRWDDRTSLTDHGPIPDGTHIAAVVDVFEDMAQRVYFTQDGKLMETRGDQKGEWRKPYFLYNATAPGVSAISYLENVRVFFQYKTDSFTVAGLNRITNLWGFDWVE